MGKRKRKKMDEGVAEDTDRSVSEITIEELSARRTNFDSVLCILVDNRVDRRVYDSGIPHDLLFRVSEGVGPE